MDLFPPKYIFDSGPFIDLKNYPQDVFPTLWNNFTQLLTSHQIRSSTEVLREIEDYDDEIAAWAKKYKSIFLKPTLEEQIIVQQILAKHPNLIRADAILSGRPYADPFVIAQAKSLSCPLVHSEKYKPNAHKIPNVCMDFNIAEMDLFTFFRQEQWNF